MMCVTPLLQRLVLGLSLCLLLVLTGQALAVARGAPLPVGQVELCTGSGPVMVALDADGNPISAPHYCPEGVLSLIQALALAPLDLQPVGQVTSVVLSDSDRPLISSPRAPARSRGPPERMWPTA